MSEKFIYAGIMILLMTLISYGFHVMLPETNPYSVLIGAGVAQLGMGLIVRKMETRYDT